MVGKLTIGSIVIRCYEFEKMLAFWQEALHYLPKEPAKGGWVILRDPEGRGPNVSLDQDPQQRTGKRSRLHLDLSQSTKRARWRGSSGSARLDIRGGTSRVMTSFVLEDPDRNLFCVVGVPVTEA